MLISCHAVGGNMQASPLVKDTMMLAGSRSLISKVYDGFEGSHFVTALSSSRTNESDLVIGLLQILQGNSSSHFYWDKAEKQFHIKAGIHVAHLSLSSLYEIVNQFLYAATCLRLVEMVVNEIVLSTRSPPTLSAFVYSVSSWLKRLRDIALAEEVKINGSKGHCVPTLLGMSNSLSSLCSGAEYLLQVVNQAVPREYLESISSIPAAEVAIHVLDYLYMKLHEVCFVQGGEEEAYQMLIYLFVGSLLPYIESIDSWLYEGILNDPFNELPSPIFSNLLDSIIVDVVSEYHRIARLGLDRNWEQQEEEIRLSAGSRAKVADPNNGSEANEKYIVDIFGQTHPTVASEIFECMNCGCRIEME